MRPSAMPKITPSTTPIKKPSTVSSTVTAICCHSGPCAVPLVAHVTIWDQMSEGWPKKKGSTQRRRVASSHPPITTTRTRARRTLTTTRRRRTAACGAQTGSSVGTVETVDVDISAGRTLFGALITHHHLIAQGLPNFLIQVHEARREANLDHVA